MNLVNGEYNNYISICDRGFQYGDGLFETIEIVDGKPVFLQKHLDRIIAGCNRLKIPPPNVDLLTLESNQLSSSAKSAVLKITITRGAGGRGYTFPESIQPIRVLSLHTFPGHVPAYAHSGIKARICDTPLGINPALAGMKHLNRLEQVMARSEWEGNDIQEGIMLDSNGYVIEGTMSNLFYVKDSIIYTAPVSMSGVAGIVRGLIKQISHDKGLAVVEHYYQKPQLWAADELFVCNSIIGIWPISSINDKQFPVGKMTRQFQQWLTEVKAKDIADAT